jgi:hypothetical protein
MHYFNIMANNFVIGKLDSNYAEAIESALWILFYYEGDRYQFLADESVICDLTEDFEYSISDAHIMLEIAQEIHRQRMSSGFYD